MNTGIYIYIYKSINLTNKLTLYIHIHNYRDVLHISGIARRLTQSRGSYSMWSKRRADQQKTYAREKAIKDAEIEKVWE